MMRGKLFAFALFVLPAAVAAGDFFTLKGHGGPLMDIAVQPGTGRIVTASFDNSLGLWDDTAPTWLEAHEAAVNTVVFSAGGLLVSAGDDFRVLSWDAASGAAKELTRHKGKVLDLAISPDERFVASASWDGTIGLTDLHEGTSIRLTRHSAGVNAVEFDNSGQLYSASVDGTIRIWDVEQAQEKRLLLRHGFGVNEMVLDAENKWMAYGAIDGVTRVIDLESDAQLADFTLERRPILAMAYSPATSRLAVGDGEGFIMVIDTDKWRISRDFRATNRGPIWALAMSPDGRNIHAGGLEETMYSWPIETLTAHGKMASEEKSYLRDPAKMTNGERQFSRKCSICHTLTPGSARRAGPTLHGLFGRRAGTVPDYSYSQILDNSDIVWDADTVDALFDEGPDHYIPGTKMPMQRIVKPEDRLDLIEYLRAETATGGN